MKRPRTVSSIVCLVALLLNSLVFGASKASLPGIHTDKILKIGVRAVNGIDDAKKIWTETANVLSQNIDGYRFELVPIVDFRDMRTAAKNKSVDFILTNPHAYVELNKQSAVTGILTLNKKQPDGVASTTFASVIFTRSDRADINAVDDMFGKSIMGVHEEAFGGWRMAFREMLKDDFDPYEDARELLFSSDNAHQTVIYSVLAGEVDIGVVRTGIIEQLVTRGEIKLDAIKVINAHQDKLSALHSTQHYPEWPFAVMPHVPNDVSNKVFHTLLEIQADSPAAMAGKYVNWAVTLDYSEVYKLTNEIAQHHITFAKIWDKHWLSILLALIFVIAIIIYTLYLVSINRKLISSETKLKGYQEHLEELVVMRTEELRAEKEKAEQANQKKSDFLSNMSHEVRTPLNAIIGFGQVLKLDANDEDTLDSVDEIIKAGKYLLSLTNEILDLATIESGKSELNLEEVQCFEVLDDSLSTLAPLLEDKGITTHFDGCRDVSVIADRMRLQQVCLNLLSNAIKYNKQGGRIEVTLSIIDKDSCEFRVKDNGIGMKPEFHEKVFEPFARDDESSDKVEGTGIGLVITKRLIEQMQGRIGFNSEVGVGTEFRVAFPMADMA